MPNSRNEMPDPSWAIREPVRITLIQSSSTADPTSTADTWCMTAYLVERLALLKPYEHNQSFYGPHDTEFRPDVPYAPVAVVLSFREDGRMYVNGQRYDVGDDFMSYTSMLEEADLVPGYPEPGTCWNSAPFNDEHHTLN
jgi:hypothetical protein